MSIPIDPAVVSRAVRELRIRRLGTASIREIRRLIDRLEAEQETRFIRMEMGIPGLPVADYAVAAEKAALDAGAASSYPPVAGIPELKQEIARFVANFVGVSVASEGCLPTVGSINGSFVTFMVAGRARRGVDTILLLNPGFPLHAAQAKILGLRTAAFDVYEYRGAALDAKLEEMAARYPVAALLYSNPNNPSWICFTEEELQIIARVADRHDIVVIEDLAYLAMDFRRDLGNPGREPYQASVARYTDRFILLISSSKAFSYAGQRVGMLVISDALWAAEYPDLTEFYPYSRFGDAVLLGTLYPQTAGVAHTAQHGLTALLKAANDGEYAFIDEVRVYGDKAREMKRHFLQNGFHLVYDRDVDREIADGFYFTVAYPGYSGEELVEALIHYGISAISLSTTGSERTEGIRACVSLIPTEEIPELGRRLEKFHADRRQGE